MHASVMRAFVKYTRLSRELRVGVAGQGRAEEGRAGEPGALTSLSVRLAGTAGETSLSVPMSVASVAS
jgi:hypothetical protein